MTGGLRRWRFVATIAGSGPGSPTSWATERGFLARLPDPLPDVDRRLEVRVARDGFIRVGDVDYSVPPGYAGRRLQVRLSTTQVIVWCEGRQLAAHRRSFVPADVILAPAHARALRLHREAKERLDGAAVVVPEADLGRYDQLAEATR